MARSKNRSSRSTARRDTFDIANQRLPRRNYEPTSTRFRKLRSLIDVEDRRQYHPDRSFRAARDIRGSPSVSLKAPSVQKGTTVSKRGVQRNTFSFTFGQPEQVATCVRRQTRKEVINALRKSGKRGQRAPRYNWRSKVRCK